MASFPKNAFDFVKKMPRSLSGNRKNRKGRRQRSCRRTQRRKKKLRLSFFYFFYFFDLAVQTSSFSSRCGVSQSVKFMML
jgi:hypothetical protein